jgi:multiple sugar transport system ATP-binding protein
MGSELYVYFDVETKQEMESDDLAELAKDAGMEDLPSGGAGQHVVARLDSDSKATAGGEVELVLDTTQIKLFDPDGGKSPTYSGGSGNGAGAKAASAAAPS